MNEQANAGPGPGALLEAARRKQGLHIAALAAQLKVAPSRLEALEAERWDELPDPTYGRALATSVCRVLGIDAAAVLQGMPRGAGAGLDRVSAGLNQPVRSRDGLRAPGLRWVLGGVLLLLAIAAALWLWPQDLKLNWRAASQDSVPSETQLPTPAAEAAPQLPAAAAPSAPASMVNMALQLEVAPTPAVASAVATVSAEGEAPLEIRASQGGASWINIVDAHGNTLASRLLQSGEVLSLQVKAPARLILGNAPALSLSWRGQPQSLQGYEQVRVAKLQLK